jgi:clan AA aspartic protease
MMQGIVDQNCEAMIRLVVGNSRDRRIAIDALIDTGFTGFLTLPKSIVTQLGLSAYSREEGTLGDGSHCIFDIYSGVVIWEGQSIPIDINGSEATPLVGMGLLYGCQLKINVVVGGQVTVATIPNTMEDLPLDRPKISQFHFPVALQARLQILLDRQAAGDFLSVAESQEARGLVEVVEFLAQLKSKI